MANILDKITIAAPCPTDWNKMTGTDQVRFCDTCKLNVYNISSMTKTETEKIIADKEGRLCVKLYRRKDGTVITENCPVGLRLIKRKLKWLIASIVALFAGTGLFELYGNDSGTGHLCIARHCEILKGTKVINGSIFHAGDSIYTDEDNGLVSAEIQTNTAMKKIECKKGDKIYMADDEMGRYLYSIKFTQTRSIKNDTFDGFGKVVSVCFTKEGYLSSAICEGGPLAINKIMFVADKHVEFYPDGRIKKGTKSKGH